MFSRRSILAAILVAPLCATGLASSATAEEITITHAQGETTLPARPDKVLVFDVASLDTLDALGVEVQGVPTAKYPQHLAKFGTDDYSKVGSLFEPDYEAVSAAEPDLIIVGGRSSPKYNDLAKLAPTIDLTVDQDDFVASAKDNVRTLAKIFGKEAEADAKLQALDASIKVARDAAADAGKGLIVLTTGGKMSAYGPGSRFGVLYSDYGVQPARTDLDTANHGQAASFELILETNPDWLFVIDRDAAIGREGEAAAQFLDNELVAQTTAWKEDQVVYLNSANWYLVGGGLTAMQQNADQIAKALSKR
ncbi:siderophore ABC transporter substrate-binding protein [Tianweitania sediminis]|uniref:Siderophore ABC transporter substrate-binding protein n=1 Tax=Tianweitania sediminis TaxID=1502156 RepID=A0A8J7RIL6_9HYPH|nr:siderophore ABC transporter substrate-binding protein [Tianweitania sediminis]MBP0437886.1 siderophore ABC transporter substrate-binding protein [Tianweitania sediminis]